MLTDLMHRLRAMFWRRSVEKEMDEEIDFDLAHRVEAYKKGGFSEHEARRRAYLAFGGVQQIREEARDARGVTVIDDLQRDIAYTVRTLGRAPVFTATAVLSLALGIGGTTAAFTLLDHVLLRPLPFPEPARLAMVYQTQLANGYPRLVTSWPNYRDWRAMTRSFESMGAYTTFPANLSGQGEPRRIEGAIATSDLFTTLRVPPRIGRTLTPADDRDTEAAVVLLSDRLAHSLFAAPDEALGRVIRLDDQPYEIVGIMPAAFAFPTPATQFWTAPRARFMDYENRSNLFLGVVGRLRAGATIEQARSDLAGIATQLERAYPTDNIGMGATAVDLHDVVSPQSRMLVLGVFVAACCLLLIACMNLANLLLGRSLARGRELAIRAAIGASRGRLSRQLLTEHAVLAIAGGTLGVSTAAFVTPLLLRLVPNSLPVGGPPTQDLRIVMFAALATIITTLGTGVATAWRSTEGKDAAALRPRTAGHGRDRVRAALVLAEVVGTVTLLIGAGLLTKALWRVQAVDPGFKSAGVLTLRTALPMPAYRNVAQRAQFYNRVLTEVRATPGVVSAGYISFLPMVFGGGIFGVTHPGGERDPRAAISSSIRYITRDFFATLRIPILRGRDVSDRDVLTAPFVTVISDGLARRLWPGEDPIGRPLNVAFADRTVVGVVRDIAVRGLERTSEPQVYLPFEQVPNNMLLFHIPKDLAIRAQDDAAALALGPVTRTIIHDVDPQQPVSDAQLLAGISDAQTAPRRTQIAALSLFAGIALVLASVGIHGLLSFAVSTRKQEVGVRLAIGATPGDIRRMFLRQGLTLGVIGIAAAVPCAYALGRAIGGLLFGVSPSDVSVYAAAAAVAFMMVATGSLRPSMQAARLDPLEIIRAE